MALLHFNNVGIAALTVAVPDFIQKINTNPEFVYAAYARNFIKKWGYGNDIYHLLNKLVQT